MSVLSGQAVSQFCSAFKKINPNGVDLAPKEVRRIDSSNAIFLSGEKRGYVDKGGRFSEGGKELVLPDGDGFYHYQRGGLYEVRFPKVTIPADCTGFAFPRSTINRLGMVKLETAVFDSGYAGEPTQTIFAPLEAMVHKDEALVQLVFIRNESPSTHLYEGRYQNEKSS